MNKYEQAKKVYDNRNNENITKEKQALIDYYLKCECEKLEKKHQDMFE